MIQRKCAFRCYHKDTDNCRKIPCKDTQCQSEKDHGVSIQITVNAVGTGAAATCKDISGEVQDGTLTGGSTARNHPIVIQ